MTRLRNSSVERRSVLAVRLTCTSEPFVRPTAERKLFAASDSRIWFGLMLNAASRSDLSQMRMAKVRPAENVRALHARQRGEPRLDHAHEIVGDLVRFQNVRREAQ